jgi:hypothetical protein
MSSLGAFQNQKFICPSHNFFEYQVTDEKSMNRAFGRCSSHQVIRNEASLGSDKKANLGLRARVNKLPKKSLKVGKASFNFNPL